LTLPAFHSTPAILGFNGMPAAIAAGKEVIMKVEFF